MDILSQLKPKDKILLENFKERIQDIRHLDERKLSSNLYLFTWLRGKGMNVDNAETSIRKAFKWREENELTEKFDRGTDELLNKFPIYLDASTQIGIPVHTIFGRHWDLRWAAENGKGDTCRRYACILCLRGENFWLEANERALQEKGVEVMYAPEMVRFIISARDVHYFHLASQRFLGELMVLTQILGSNFPGIALDIIFVDVPTIFVTILQLIKRLVSFAGRISVYNCNRKIWMEALSQFCPVEQLAHGFCDDSPVEDLLHSK